MTGALSKSYKYVHVVDDNDDDDDDDDGILVCWYAVVQQGKEIN